MALSVRTASSTLALVAALSALSGTTLAASYSIGSMNITGGTYSLWDSTGASIIDSVTGSAVSPFTSFGSDTNLVGGYIGSGGSGTPPSSPNATSIANAVWSGTPVSVYTAASNLGDTYTPAGTITGGPVPSGTLDSAGGTITMNLSGLFANLADEDFNVGTGKVDVMTSSLATGTWDPVTHAYSLSWISSIIFPGLPACPGSCWKGQFTLTGTATPVPAPAALWLLVSGLAGFGAWMRKRQV